MSGHKRLVLQGEPKDVDRIWLLSVRHSGTHYMYLPLGSMGYERCLVDWERLQQKHSTGSKQYIHAHIDVGAEYLKHLTDEKVVMPLRNPVECYRTHVYRYRRGIRSWEHITPIILYAYEELRRVWLEKNAFVYRIDSDNQEYEWLQLHNFLGAKQGLAYKQQPNNVSTSRKFPITTKHGYTEDQERLFANPPDEIWKLAESFGY